MNSTHTTQTAAQGQNVRKQIDEIDAQIANTADPLSTDRLYAKRDKLVAQAAEAQPENSVK